MCGIVAVLPVYPAVEPPPAAVGLTALQEAAESVSAAEPRDADQLETHLLEVIVALRQAVREASEPAAGHRLVVDPELRAAAAGWAGTVRERLQAADGWLDGVALQWDPDDVERVQSRLRIALDLAWTLAEDRVAAAGRVARLARAGATAADPAGDLSPRASVGYWALDTALDAIDRLEVRGRDSAGVHLWIGLDPDDRATAERDLARRADRLFRTGTAVCLPGGVSVVYKTASVVGRLGDNVAAIRAEVEADAALHRVMRLPSARVSVLSHTRWASVGRVSVPNAHPMNSEITRWDGLGEPGTTFDGGPGTRYAVAVLNGDVDNHVALRDSEGVPDDPDITTDAKVIPVMVARRLATGRDGASALAECLRLFDGSTAIGVQADDDPDRLVLGIKGGGQGLFVGLAPYGYIVASEIFGIVARADRYLSLEDLAGSTGLHEGTVAVIDRRGAGAVEGVSLIDASGERRVVGEASVRSTELTTRDVACRDYDRYLEKELAEAPSSFAKTLRGRVRADDGRLSVNLPASTLPAAAVERLRSGAIEEIIVVGQGTAAVAASGVAHLLNVLLGDRPTVRATPATELSATRLPHDMSRTCVVAISQSGTTTDTNRTVDLVRARGATVLAIVNRRQSDLVAKSHGVLYTSDGRDIEMAVASTKAFYAQIAAGMLLGLALGRTLGAIDPDAEDAYLRALTEIPEKLEELQRRKGQIADLAQRLAPRHTYWAVVGSGPNRVAASEVRIKLSELCYRGVAADAVEDKKHIDLSAESLILLCAAGAPVTQLADLAKEVAIFSAHRNVPIVITDEGGPVDQWPTENVIEVPAADPLLAWVLSTAAGHLFAYFAARALDAEADDLREALAALDGAETSTAPADLDGAPAARASGAVGDVPDGAARAGTAAVLRARVADPEAGVVEPLGRVVERCAGGALRGALGSPTALRLASAYWYLHGGLPADAFLASLASPHPVAPSDALRQVLTDAVDELSRPIDSVKHQAKTVTVGTSRTGADLLEGPLVRAVLDLGVQPEALSYSALLALDAHAQIVTGVIGATRYSIVGTGPDTFIRVTRKSGIAAGLASRADQPAALSGTKKLTVDTRAVRLERGRLDGRVVLLVPETSGRRVAGLSLLHVELAEQAKADQLVAALEVSANRLAEIRAAITEQNLAFDPQTLALLSPEEVLLAPVDQVVARVIALQSAG